MKKIVSVLLGCCVIFIFGLMPASAKSLNEEESIDELLQKYGAVYEQMEQEYLENIEALPQTRSAIPYTTSVSANIPDDDEVVTLTSLFYTEPVLTRSDTIGQERTHTIAYGRVWTKTIVEESGSTVRLVTVAGKVLSVDSGFRCTGYTVNYGQNGYLNSGSGCWSSSHSGIFSDYNLYVKQSQWVENLSTAQLGQNVDFKFRRGTMTSDYVVNVSNYYVPNGL